MPSSMHWIKDHLILIEQEYSTKELIGKKTASSNNYPNPWEARYLSSGEAKDVNIVEGYIFLIISSVTPDPFMIECKN